MPRILAHRPRALDAAAPAQRWETWQRSEQEGLDLEGLDLAGAATGAAETWPRVMARWPWNGLVDDPGSGMALDEGDGKELWMVPSAGSQVRTCFPAGVSVACACATGCQDFAICLRAKSCQGAPLGARLGRRPRSASPSTATSPHSGRMAAIGDAHVEYPEYPRMAKRRPPEGLADRWCNGNIW